MYFDYSILYVIFVCIFLNMCALAIFLLSKDACFLDFIQLLLTFRFFSQFGMHSVDTFYGGGKETFYILHSANVFQISFEYQTCF